MKNIKFSTPILIVSMLLGISIFSTSCDKQMGDGIYRISDDKMLDELAEEAGLTDFLTIVEKAGLEGTIHSYGTYTLFAPTNEAIAAYLQSHAKSSVNDLTAEEASEIVKYHLIPKALGQADFVDGRLAYRNFTNRYITTKAGAEDNKVVYSVNRQAKIVTADIVGANGYLHVIDNVLTKPVNTVTEMIQQLPEDEFSFFKNLFDKSGWADSLSTINDNQWFTFFVQNNESFTQAGIHSEDDLLDQLQINTPAVSRDSLIYNFVGYHIVNRLAYVADLMAASSLLTMIPEQVIIFKRVQDQVLLNDIQMGKTHEIGIPLLRNDYTDLSCANGVLHQIGGNIVIKNRTAYRIYWDVAEQPELMAMGQFRNIQNNAFGTSFKPGELSEVTWGGKAPGNIDYYFGGYSSSFDEKFQYVYGDYLRFVLHPNVTSWIEFKTPVLIKGKYKVWVCYRRELDATIKTTFKQSGYDDQVLPYVFDMSAYMPSPAAPSSDEQIALDGWKLYNAKKYNSVVISHLLGTIDVQNTGQHTLRFETTKTSHNTPGNWDLIQFIPIDEDQLWPRVDIKGDWIYPDVPNCQIWPYSECETAEEEE